MRKIIYDLALADRVDAYLSDLDLELSRSEIQRMIKSGDILVNDEKVKASYKLVLDDVISVAPILEVDDTIVPIDFPIEVIYEDEDLIVINKPQGLVVYPGSGREDKSVVAALLGMGVALYESEDKLRIGIVHRLDKDTSGLMILSKSEKAHFDLMAAFKDRSVVRKYYALVDGVVLHNFGTIDAPIGRDEHNRTKMAIVGDGREAKTFFKLKEKTRHASLLECELYTGRTHQIRVHMQYIKHPIIGDPIYRKKTIVESDNLMLQSFNLEFSHPIDGREMKFELPLREDFTLLMNGDE